MKNKKMFKEYMTLLGEIFDKEISDTLKSVYWNIVKNYDDEKVENAFKQVIATSKFFPKPADFIEILIGNAEERAIKAWQKVYHAVKHIGQYASVQFDDPVIHSVIKAMGGWYEFQEPKNWDETWSQKQFIKLYSIMEKKNDHPEKCVGLIEVENVAKGFSEYNNKPIMIGDRQQVKQIKEQDEITF